MTTSSSTAASADPILAVPGVRIGTAAAGIRYQGREDLALFELAPNSSCAAVFTRNAFCAAPVVVARRHLASRTPRWWLVNAGNANAGTGAEGLAAAEASCRALGELGHCPAGAVLPFSTGVIGEPLPVDRLQAALPAALRNLSPEGWAAGARAIMTTDGYPKLASRRVALPDGGAFTLSGMAKGAGMIRPDMATMLAFLATDAPLAPALTEQLLRQAVARSFNRITVDGDTSTNDAVALAATGAAGGAPVESEADPRFAPLAQALESLCRELAHAIVRDGEGASKFITLEVHGGASERECLDVAYTVAHSPLVKTAFFASDANWGRILAAVGRAGIDGLDIDAVTLDLGPVRVVEGGGRAPGYTEQAGQAVMAERDIRVRIGLGRGEAAATVWTTDLSHEYVRINADYRS